MAEEDPPPSFDEMLAELDREIAIRKRIYPKWIADGNLSPEKADHRIRVMEGAREVIKTFAALLEALPRFYGTRE